MKKIRYTVVLTAAAVMALAGCGKKAETPTPSANVPVVSETPAIESPDMSALVSPMTSEAASPAPSPAAGTETGSRSPAA